MAALLKNPSRRALVDKRLRFRLAIFLAIGLVILGFVGYDVLRAELSWWLALLAIALGVLAGYGIGRAAQIRWHETEEKVVSQMDVVGIAAILIYVGFRFSSNWLIGHWLTGVALSTFTLAVLGGALVGRFLGIRHSVKRTLDRPRA
jgi:O-antigen/teichoic acid export membrane protein